MADTPQAFDWSSITGNAVVRMRQPKTPPKPHDNLIALAQRSYDGVAHPDLPEGELTHKLDWTFDTATRAAEFAKELRKAGAHTTPPSSLTVTVDKEDPRRVEWRAGERKGAKVY